VDAHARWPPRRGPAALTNPRKATSVRRSALRDHRVVDVIAGVALAAAVLGLQKRLGPAAPSERAVASEAIAAEGSVR
jgi:hypothetical protein